MPSAAPPPPVRFFPAALMFALALSALAIALALRSLGRPSDEPLRVLPLVPADAGAFRADAFPTDLPGRDDLPALGNWSPGSDGRTGTWTSATLTTSAALLQFRVLGTLEPPATSLVLRSGDGREIAPLETNFSTLARWKRINFPAPGGPFQIVALATSPGGWLAFTAPVEISRWSWLAGKLARPWLIEAFTVLAGGLACAGLFHLRGFLVILAASRAWRYVPWIALAAYAAFFSRHIDPVAGPNDSGGYLNSAKALASGHLGPSPRPIWGPAAGETDLTPYLASTFPSYYAAGRMAPEYSVGMPLLVAAAGSVLGMDRAVPLVIWLNLVLGVVFVRLFARSVGLSEGWSWLAAAIIGLSPVYLHQGLQPQSDSIALVWCTAAVYWAWTSREHPWRALPAGLATGLAVFIRPSDLLLLLPLLIVLVGYWRQFGLWVAAGLPCAVWLGWHNYTLHGGPFVTGYRDQIYHHFFSLDYLANSLPFYARWLPVVFTPLVVLALAGPFLRAIPFRLRLMLAAWAGIFSAFYACYWYTQDDWFNTRFLLPAAPAMVVLALLAAQALAERAGFAFFRTGTFGRNFLPSCLLVTGIAGLLIQQTREHQVLYWMHNNARNADGPRWLITHVPSNAVVFARHATNSILYYTDLTFVRSDHPKAQSPEFFAAIARTGRPIYAFNYWFEDHNGAPDGVEDRPGPDRGRPLLPGHWIRIAMLNDQEIHVWQRLPEPAADKK